MDAYNAVSDFFRAQSRFDEITGAGGPLSGDPTLRGVEHTIDHQARYFDPRSTPGMLRPA